MIRIHDCTDAWRRGLLEPESAGQLISGREAPEGFIRFLTVVVILLYGSYGFSMGLFHSFGAGAVSAVKLPILFLLTLSLCLPALYTLNGLYGPRFSLLESVRIVLLATSVNALALGSYAPFSFFFVMTTSNDGYNFLVLMHVAVFALAGILSLFTIAVLMRAAGTQRKRPVGAGFIASWMMIYGFVGSQVSWTLRPWIGARGIEYQILRPIEGSFAESVWRLIQSQLLGG